mgnify:CR=1 FL=1
MEICTLIKGEKLTITEDWHEEAFSIGSKIQWGNKVWEIVKATNGCEGCYFYGNRRCYCNYYWFERLGPCSQIVRPDKENVNFQLHRL